MCETGVPDTEESTLPGVGDVGCGGGPFLALMAGRGDHLSPPLSVALGAMGGF